MKLRKSSALPYHIESIEKNVETLLIGLNSAYEYYLRNASLPVIADRPLLGHIDSIGLNKVP